MKIVYKTSKSVCCQVINKCKHFKENDYFEMAWILYRFASESPLKRLKTHKDGNTRNQYFRLYVRSSDASKLLIYNKGVISDTVFSHLPEIIPSGSLMVFNNTKVVPARLLFRRATGAFIEIFCLEPAEPEDYNLCFASCETCIWNVIVGNKKKWKGEPIKLYLPDNHSSMLENLDLEAVLENDSDGKVQVRFTWRGGEPFSKVMELCGKVPIPPYLHRDSESIDNERYQTLYASYRGSVAAPTAGLHFSENVLKELNRREIECRSWYVPSCKK